MMNKGAAPNKPKDRQYKKPSKLIRPSQYQRATTQNKKESWASSKQLLAGYMAHEFLSKGTLLGQVAKPGWLAEPSGKIKRHEKYMEITGLFNRDVGVGIPGAFNPTQVNSFSQM